MTTDDQQRIQALLDERAKLIRLRDDYGRDLAELLVAARALSRTAGVAEIYAGEEDLLEALDRLDALLRRFESGQWEEPSV